MGNELTINPKTIFSELQKLKPQIESAIPRHMSPDRMARIALTCLRTNPKLFDCTPESFFGSIIAAAQLGLEPGVNGQCYLVPYKNTCTMVPGWKGLVDLIARAGRSSAWTGAVRKGDFFEYQLGSNPKLRHEPGDEDVGPFTHTYAIGWVKDAQWPLIEVWSRTKVQKHLSQYNKVGDRHYALQNENNLEMYGRKVALLQIIKYLPSSVELRDAQTLDSSAAEGKQNLTIDTSLQSNFEGGDAAETVAEAEALMQKLDWPIEKRNGFRSQYQGQMEKGVAYLNEEVSRAGRANSTPAPAQGQASRPARTARRSAEQAPEGDAAPAEEQPTETTDKPKTESWM